MSKHTPGPWIAEGDEVYAEQDCGIHPILGNGFNNPSCRDIPERLANARLIAAAPDLLEALQAVIRNDAENRDEFGLSVNVCKKAIAAITKATGEP